MWKKIATFSVLSYLSYKLYKNNYIWDRLKKSLCLSSYKMSPFFLTSQDINLKDYVCEVGHVEGLGSCLRLRDKNNTEIVFSKLNKTENLIEKENTVIYHFDRDITLTFRKKETIECKFKRNEETIDWDVTDFIKNYKKISFNTDFDLLSSFQ